MNKLILAAAAAATLATPLVATAAEAQTRTVITERGPRGHVVARTVVTRPYARGWHRWQRNHRPYRHHYVVRTVRTHYR
jgi:hypothetical protein